MRAEKDISLLVRLQNLYGVSGNHNRLRAGCGHSAEQVKRDAPADCFCRCEVRYRRRGAACFLGDTPRTDLSTRAGYDDIRVQIEGGDRRASNSGA